MKDQRMWETIRDGVLGAIASHERDEHGGKACMEERANIIAHLAHSLGVRGVVWNHAQKLLDEYDRHCPGCGHVN
jgi:hypothetical protein